MSKKESRDLEEKIVQDCMDAFSQQANDFSADVNKIFANWASVFAGQVERVERSVSSAGWILALLCSLHLIQLIALLILAAKAG